MANVPIRVMIVDDSRQDLQSVELTLSGRADVVAKATSGEDALRLAHEVSFDVAVIDYRMPGMNGLAVAECLKAINPSVKTILLTAFDDVEMKFSDNPYVDHFHHKVFVDTLVEALDEIVTGESSTYGEDPRGKRVLAGLFRRR